MADTHVTVAGNLTADPELKFTTNGAAVANFRIAVTARVRDGEGWKDGDTSFFRVNAWRALGQHVTDSLSKGDRAVVVGRLKSRSWETPEGEQRSTVEIDADEVAPSLRFAVAKPERAARNGEASKAAGQFTGEPPF
jgi:single-strand DNA-binding protein